MQLMQRLTGAYTDLCNCSTASETLRQNGVFGVEDFEALNEKAVHQILDDSGLHFPASKRLKLLAARKYLKDEALACCSLCTCRGPPHF